jgi:putative AdoMet-dependent methyltransferase
LRNTIEKDPYPASEFDEWAATYDESIAEHSIFPFDGYWRVLDEVLMQARVKPGVDVLDLGTGTANLAILFSQAGCHVWCSDYSAEMLIRAKAKLPNAHFAQADLRSKWPADLDRRFDRIVSAYVFHHFPLAQKVSMLAEMAKNRLQPSGKIVIADISFENASEKAIVARKVGEDWVDEEYWVAAEVLPALRQSGLDVNYKQVSSCAGVYCIKPNKRRSRKLQLK